MPFAMIALAYFIPKLTYGIALLTIVIGEAIIFFQSRRLLRQFGDLKLFLHDEAVERQSGSFSEYYELKDISTLVVSQDNSENVFSIKLKSGKKSVILVGF